MTPGEHEPDEEDYERETNSGALQIVAAFIIVVAVVGFMLYGLWRATGWLWDILHL